MNGTTFLTDTLARWQHYRPRTRQRTRRQLRRARQSDAKFVKVVEATAMEVVLNTGL